MILPELKVFNNAYYIIITTTYRCVKLFYFFTRFAIFGTLCVVVVEWSAIARTNTLSCVLE